MSDFVDEPRESIIDRKEAVEAYLRHMMKTRTLEEAKRHMKDMGFSDEQVKELIAKARSPK